MSKHYLVLYSHTKQDRVRVREREREKEEKKKRSEPMFLIRQYVCMTIDVDCTPYLTCNSYLKQINKFSD